MGALCVCEDERAQKGIFLDVFVVISPGLIVDVRGAVNSLNSKEVVKLLRLS